MSNAHQDLLVDGWLDVSASTFMVVNNIVATGIGTNTLFPLQPQFLDLMAHTLKK